MITGISIENFKGIGERVDIELRPITLLFGANSAGKSTVLHALQYAAHVLSGADMDVRSMGNGQGTADLGGFQNLVHNHDLNNEVKVGFRIGLKESDGPFQLERENDLDGATDSWDFFGIEICIRWNRSQGKAYLRSYKLLQNSVPLMELSWQWGRPHCDLAINARHPRLHIKDGHTALDWEPVEGEDDRDNAWFDSFHELLQYAKDNGLISHVALPTEPWTDVLGVTGLSDALPDFDEVLSIYCDEDEDRPGIPYLGNALRSYVSDLFLLPGKALRDELNSVRSLGPLRETPPRHHSPSPQNQESRWASGLGAWDLLHAADDPFVELTSDWLGGEDRLKSGYRLRVQRYKELDLSDPLLLKLQTGRAFDDVEADTTLDLSRLPTHTRILIIPDGGKVELRPDDVGIGISQVIPVIVTALDGKQRIASIEQPELHLHPRVQAELGDLFIESAFGDRQQTFILETHSEHLILRLLRRIRETTDGDLPSGKPPLKPDDIAVYYVQQRDDEGTEVRLLRIDDSGEFIDQWPDGFFEERAKELF